MAGPLVEEGTGCDWRLSASGLLCSDCGLPEARTASQQKRFLYRAFQKSCCGVRNAVAKVSFHVASVTMTCILRAAGADFNVDEFMGSSSLAIDTSWRKGEKRSRIETSEEVNSSSGVRVIASHADFTELAKQVADATSFLKQNLSAIQGLSSYPGVEWVLLDFGAEMRPPGWASFTFPVDMVRLAAAAGAAISLSVYPTDSDGESAA